MVHIYTLNVTIRNYTDQTIRNKSRRFEIKMHLGRIAKWNAASTNVSTFVEKMKIPIDNDGN